MLTGTNIRGAGGGSSPLVTVSRDEIERAGQSTVGAAVAALPQNFGGTSTEDTSLTSSDRTTLNEGLGSGANLRGLGSDATLTLINGRRVAGAGGQAEFTDISMIPLAAVERIEVLADGASAIYGSDAVGGVINVILRKSFKGGETRFYSGVPTQGGASEVQVGQVLGSAWGGGHALIAYEYSLRERLRARERDYTRSADLRPLGGSDWRSFLTREADFSAWYQSVIAEADLAEESGVRGCMVIRPWGYGIWERIQRLLDDRIKATGHENCYFPLFIPLSYFEKEAEHVEGFAKEMAVVTHHRLKADGKGGLIPDPEAKLEEPLVVRPTSEMVIGAAFARWVQSWRDLPVLINQWANVVRWEMRTRMFLRTSEFLWQEGHTAHASAEEAREETLKMLEVYRSFSEDCLALPVVAGEKPENERFPGAVATYSIEAMMQDGKALQAGTSHFLGTNFASAQNIRFQNDQGEFVLANTTSWGVSTRMIGGVIMVHGDDDGLRVPPRIAPWQIVIVPMLRDQPEDAAIVDYCKALQAELANQSALREPVRALLDLKFGKAATKRWGWVKKGAPIVIEVGGRDVAGGNVSVIRRDRLYREDGKLDSAVVARGDFVGQATGLLEEIQAGLHAEARARLEANIVAAADFAAIETHFADGAKNPGWLEVQWSRPTGATLDAVVERLKALKLTIRNAPMQQAAPDGACVFTGNPAVERVLIGRAY